MNRLEIGQFVRTKRKRLGLTQAQLAYLANVTTKTLSNVEQGNNINLETLVALSGPLKLEVRVEDRGGPVAKF